MDWLERLKGWMGLAYGPEHLRVGARGERAAKEHLRQQGLKFLTANFKSKRGEIDLVFREETCLVFVEVKTRSSEEWTRPADAVDRRKRRALARAAWDYMRKLTNPRVPYRFDIVEVLIDAGDIAEVRHVRNAFNPDEDRKSWRR